MYPSDYGYATSGGSTNNRTSCLNTSLNSWNSYSDCYSKDWIYNSSYQWTISPTANSADAYSVFYVYSNVDLTSALNPAGVRPSVYLLSSTSILSGEGTPENPYTIAD